MSLYALYGTGYNQLARMATAATPEAADSLFPIANLYDGAPWKPFRFGAAGTSGYINFDMNQVVNGGFETAFSGGVPGSGWTLAGSATATRVAAPAPPVGTYCLDVGGGYAAASGNSVVYTVSVAAGEVLTLEAYLYAVGAPSTEWAQIWVRNMATGSYWNGTTWSPANTACFTHNAASWSALKTSTFTIESYTTGLSDRVNLQIRCDGSGTGAQHAYYDEVVLYPRINFVSIHGHNLQPYQTPIDIRSGTTSPGATVRAQMTLAHPTMFSTFANVDARYWRFFSTNDPLESATWLGEMVLGQYQTLTRRQNFGQDLTLRYSQDRSESDLGVFASYVRQTDGRRTVGLRFRYNDDTDYEQAREIVERSQAGAHPMILVLESGDETQAMLGRIEPEWSHTRITNTMRDAEWKFTELPFPTVMP